MAMEGNPQLLRRRSRWELSDDTRKRLTQIIAHYADTPSFLEYPEDFDSPVDKARIQKHPDLFCALHTMKKSLVFPKLLLIDVLHDVAGLKKDQWSRPLTDKEMKDWAERMQKRIRVACRHLSQAKHKNNGWALRMLVMEVTWEPQRAPDWRSEMVAARESAASHSEPAASQAPANGPSESQSAGSANSEMPLMATGYDRHLNLAWRRAQGGQKEFSEAIVCSNKANDIECIQAQFGSGPLMDIPQMTIAEFKMIEQSSAKQKRGANAVWSQEYDSEILKICWPILFF